MPDRMYSQAQTGSEAYVKMKGVPVSPHGHPSFEPIVIEAIEAMRQKTVRSLSCAAAIASVAAP
jgi:hypothetical protein